MSKKHKPANNGLYTYDPGTDAYIIPAATLARMIHRIGSPKDKIDAEDCRENERRIAATRDV